LRPVLVFTFYLLTNLLYMSSSLSFPVVKCCSSGLVRAHVFPIKRWCDNECDDHPLHVLFTWTELLFQPFSCTRPSNRGLYIAHVGRCTLSLLT